MLCSGCHAENKEGRRFCAACGAALPVTCAACAFENELEASFCGGCGAPLAPAISPSAALRSATFRAHTPAHLAERILRTRAALEGERKQVTVLFADIKGSLEMLVGRDPEEAQRLLDPVVERMMSAVHRYEGTVNQVMGDGIMALFGAPVAHEDHALRAGYAALRMQAAIGGFAEEARARHGIELAIRVGLNSGEVLVRGVGNDLRMDYSAIGQTTHLAARMEQTAIPGTIRVTEAFVHLAGRHLHVKPLGLVSVKGLTEPIDVFELVGAEPTRARFPGAGEELTRFVGREAELVALHSAAQRVLAGQGETAAIVGDPGVGKSRLLHEILDSDHTRGWLILQAGALSYEKSHAYFAVRDLLRGYLQIEDRDTADQVREKLTSKLAALGDPIPDALPALQSLLDLPVDDNPSWSMLDPAGRRQRILGGIVRLLRRQGEVQPLLLVFENLHWADSETQAFLDDLVTSVPTARILLLLSYRPDFRSDWSGRRGFRELRLSSLPVGDTEVLLRGLLGNGGHELAAFEKLVIQQTDGNPFFLEESLRTLVETGTLAGERGAYRLTKELSTLEVPPTVQAVLAARIDRLRPGDKHLLQCAAILGESVSLPLIQAVTTLPDDDLRRSLAHLQAAEFLYEATLYPELEYAFKHSLTRQVAYGGIVLDRRHALHATAVECIERLHGDRLGEHVERLALHAFRGELWEKSARYAREAATKAVGRSGYREAVTWLEQGLTSLAHLPGSREVTERAIDLRLDLRNALIPLGDYDRILGHLREAESLAREFADQSRLGRVLAYLTTQYRLMGQHGLAVEAGQRALVIAETSNDLAMRVTTNLYLAAAYRLLGEHGRAMVFFRRNLEILDGGLARERFGMPGLASVLTRTGLVWCLTDTGDFDEGLRRGREAVETARAADHPFSLGVAMFNVGLLHLMRGSLETAVALLEEALHLCRTRHIGGWSDSNAAALGYAYALSGRPLDGVSLLEEGLRKSVYPALFTSWLSEALLAAGRNDDARAAARRAVDLSRARGEQAHEGYALRALGDVAGRGTASDRDEAEGAYRQALTLAQTLAMRPLEARCYVGLAGLHHQGGARAEAVADYETAISLFRAMGMEIWARRAEQSLSAPAL